ncbi:MAG: hypothetical protein J7J11_04090, partial [Desulfurococcales archaeon]|nr:hypothetical protein [Desulfurococcales archaeon]
GLYTLKYLFAGEIMRKSTSRDRDYDDEIWDEIDSDLTLFRYFVSEPMIEVRDEGDKIRVLMEANGSRARDVAVEVIRPKFLDVSLKYKGRHIRKRIELPTKVRSTGHQVKIKNGVLQVILHKSR